MKTCSRCNTAKQFSEFTKRTASKDGLSSACTKCLKKQKRIDYICEPEKTMLRVKKNHRARLDDLAYRRAWHQWVYAKAAGRVPKWVRFARDMLPKYRELLSQFPDWSVDHVIPLQGKDVSGLHVPSNLQVMPLSDNSSKGAAFSDNLLKLHDFKSQATHPPSDKI